MSDIKCPYCDAEQEVNHDDGCGYSEDETHEMQCSECNKHFVFTTSIIYCYYPEKADCLNEGGEHDWKARTTCPKEYTKMRCSMCDKERKPTEIEMKEIIGNA